MIIRARNIRPQQYIALACLIDNALPECKWKRLFQTLLLTEGLDAAYAKWRGGPIANEQFVPQIEKLIEEIKRDHAERQP